MAEEQPNEAGGGEAPVQAGDSSQNEVATAPGLPPAPEGPVPVLGPGAPPASPSPLDLGQQPNGNQGSGFDTGRRVLALLVVLAVVSGFFYSRGSGELRSCETKVTRTSGTPAKVEREENCKPLPIEAVVPALLLVLALMWPDLSSVQLFGLGQVTRRLSEQDSRQNQLESAQQRLENEVAANASAQANAVAQPEQTVNNVVGTDPAVALLVEEVANSRKTDGTADASASAPVAGKDEMRARFETVTEWLLPWLEVARRMNDPQFAAAVRGGAASGTPSDDPNLLPSDRVLLLRVQRSGHPFGVEALERWLTENELQLATVRDTLRAGTDAASESLRVATQFAEQLLSDLQRRGLVTVG